MNRFLKIASAAVMLAMLLFAGCGKNKVEGVWASTKTPSTIEFNATKTGIIHQRAQAKLPSDLPFTWNMVSKEEFTIAVTVPGSPAPVQGRGRLEGNTLILENDIFTRAK